MNDQPFSRYTNNHVHFLEEVVPSLVELGLHLKRFLISKLKIIDLGCGDGRLIYALYKKGFLFDKDEVWGVDISSVRIKRLRSTMPFIRCRTLNALNARELPNSSFDFIICSQLIEHVNDALLLHEIKRLLKNNGLAYISSVAKKNFAVYFYFKNGTFRLDPTHVREYSSLDEFVHLMLNQGLQIIETNSQPIEFSIIDLIMRFFIRIGLVKSDAMFYHKHKNLNNLRSLKIRIMGYSTIEALVRLA